MIPFNVIKITIMHKVSKEVFLKHINSKFTKWTVSVTDTTVQLKTIVKMVSLGFILVIVQCIIGTFGQYLNFPGLLPDGELKSPCPKSWVVCRLIKRFRAGPLVGPGRGPSPPLQADVSISAGLPRGIFSSLFGDLQPFLPEPGCRGGCHGGQICRGNSCTCPTGLVFVRGLCGPKLVPLIQVRGLIKFHKQLHIESTTTILSVCSWWTLRQRRRVHWWLCMHRWQLLLSPRINSRG